MAQLETLLAELEINAGEPVYESVYSRFTKTPIEFRQMPSPIGVPTEKKKESNKERKKETLLSKTPKEQTYEGKPGPLCHKCLLKNDRLGELERIPRNSI